MVTLGGQSKISAIALVKIQSASFLVYFLFSIFRKDRSCRQYEILFSETMLVMIDVRLSEEGCGEVLSLRKQYKTKKYLSV